MDILDFLIEEEVVPAADFEESAPGTTEEILTIEEEIEEVTVSGDEVVDLLKAIDEKLERIGNISENNIKYVSVPGDNVWVDVPDNVSSNTLTVSQDSILTKNLNEYSTQESLLLINFILIFFVLVFIGIRKAVFKWR